MADERINIRISSCDKDIIWSAAEKAGVTASDFMRGAAIDMAREVLMDQPRTVIASEEFCRILDIIDGA